MKKDRIPKDVVKERFTVYIPESTVKRIHLVAGSGRQTLSKLVDDAVLMYLDKEDGHGGP